MSNVRGGNGVVVTQATTATFTCRVSDLIGEIRANLSEFSAEYFTDARILSWMNRANLRVYNDIGMVYKQHFTSTTNITYVADQETYALPLDFKRVVKILRTKDSSGTALNMPWMLTRLQYHDADEYKRYLLANENYYIEGNNTGRTYLGIIPIPDSAVTDVLEVTYLAFPTKLTLGGIARIPYDYCEALVLYTTYKALNAEDEGRGRTYLGEYKDLTRDMLHDLEARDESFPDTIRPTDWND